MPAFRVDKFCAGRTKFRSPMLKKTWWNSLALFLIVNLKGVLKPYLGLDLIDPRSSQVYFLMSPLIQVIPLLFLGTGAVGFFVSIQFASGISWLAEHVDLTGEQSHH